MTEFKIWPPCCPYFVYVDSTRPLMKEEILVYAASTCAGMFVCQKLFSDFKNFLVLV